MRSGNSIGWHNWPSNLFSQEESWPDREAFESYSYRSVFEHLTAVRRCGDLTKGDFPLICVLRNEAVWLPIFFDHYKRLGVTRFMMIDNNSDDDSRELLLAEKSADVFFTRKSFIDGQSGLYWVNGLAHALCQDHWTLRVDADELLVYDGMEKHGLADLAPWLKKRGLDRFFAPMRDLYSSSPLSERKDNVAEILQNDCWFDSAGYKLEKWREGWHITGGPRERLFASESNWLSKYPFFSMTEKISIVSHHFLWPLDQSLQGPMGALLHLRMLTDFADRSRRHALERQHWGGSAAYRTISEVLKEAPETVAFNEDSKRYEGPQSLIRHGLMQPIDWEA